MEGGTQPPPDGMEGEAQPPSACVSKVLDDDNLLTEIIVRVGFPTSLVRAAAVCRRWLNHASDRAFLRRFREHHPPRPLGFYIVQRGYRSAARFFPMLPHPPELAAVVRRANFSLGTWDAQTMVGCSNGSVLTQRKSLNMHTFELVVAVHNPLCYERGMAILPRLQLRTQVVTSWAQVFSKQEGDGPSYFYLIVEAVMKPTFNVYMLQNGDDAWHKHLTLASDLHLHPRSSTKPVLVGNKIYVPSDPNEIVILDLTTSILSTIQLPQGLGFGLAGSTMLSRADDASGVYLIYIKGVQLHIWFHKGDNWLLVDTICLSEMCANLLEDQPTPDIWINHVGDYNEFVFLEMGRCALYLDVKRRTLCKVYEMTTEEHHLGDIYPFMMSWPPIFPALRDCPARNAT